MTADPPWPTPPARLPPEAPPGLVYWPHLLSDAEQAEHCAALVAEVPWETHTFQIFGRVTEMPRRIQMYGPHGYHYSGVHHPPRPLTPRLQHLRDRVSAATGLAFNSVLVNLYRHGRDSMGWHTDDDYPHGGQPAVASVSLGATRRFRLRLRQKASPRPSFGLDLAGGSLLLMDGPARTDWQHALPRTARAVEPRVNLTFRQMLGR